MTIEKNAKWVSPSPILPDKDLHFVEGGHCLSLANHIKVWIVAGIIPGNTVYQGHIMTVSVLDSGSPIMYLKS